MIKPFRRVLPALLVLAAACSPGLKSRPAGPELKLGEPQQKLRPTTVTATILQLNDVYEIMPLGGSGLGGLARVATLRQQLLRENPNTFTVLAGDLLSPSALSSAKASEDGTALNGRHMVDIMNRIGLDYAVFGNHEFDLKKPDFDKRMQESKFQWISSNVLSAEGGMFPGTKANVALTAKNAAGHQLRIGMFGLTIDSNKAAYVRYREPFAEAREQVQALKSSSDVIIALTHLALAQDEQLAESVPGLAMILGGHEHQNIDAYRGPAFVPVLKADSNAKSVYVHRLAYDTNTRKLAIDSKLIAVDERIAEDPEVATAVRDWRDRAFAAFKKDGVDAEKVVTTLTEMLDGRESAVRYGSTNLTAALGSAMLAAFPGAQASIFNSGSIRIDDTLGPGPITQYDVLRVLPYPGNLFLVSMKGSLLMRIITAGRDDTRRGTGGWLQADVTTAAIDLNADYRVVMNDYLLNGLENGLEWIKPATSGIVVLPNPPIDFRRAVIAWLSSR